MFRYHNAPKYLSSRSILWESYFNYTLRKIGLPEFKQLENMTINVEFSDEEPYTKYGSLTLEEIKNKIRKQWKTNDKIEEDLSHLNGYRDFKCSEQLKGDIAHYNDTSWDKVDKTINNWFKYYGCTLPVLGQYINSSSTIILYTKNIEKSAINGKSKEQAVEETFIHELFHAYHYSYNKEELFRRYDYTSDVIIESLASAFEWFYVLEEGIPGFNELKNSWEEFSVFTYPYSGARELIGYDFNKKPYTILEKNKFCKIFDTSLNDMDVALRTLLDIDDFYDIKNAVEIKKEFMIVPGGNGAKPNINIYKVNQSKNLAIESKGGYIFAPDRSRYIAIKSVKKGDVIFHIFDSMLHGISIATSDCYRSPDAHGRGEAGLYVDALYLLFPAPISLSKLKKDPSYPIIANEPYIREFNYPNFIHLLLKEVRKKYSIDNLGSVLSEI